MKGDAGKDVCLGGPQSARCLIRFFLGKGCRDLSDEGRGQFNIKFCDFEEIQRLAIARQFELAAYQARRFKFLQVQM